MENNNLNGKIINEGITFDDVLLVPAYSDVLPNEVNLKTKLTKNIELNIPILSAAMDTVTESALAIEIARAGGIGVIHKNLTIEEQALEVQKVKRNESGFIKDPITIKSSTTVSEANKIMATYKISGLPIVDENKKLIGIVTNRDLKYFENFSETVDTIMTKENLITGTPETTLDQAKQIMLKNKIEKLPIVDNTNTLTGLITTKDIDKAIDHPNACKDQRGRLRVAAAVGVAEDTMARVDALIKAEVDALVVDSAHGHSKGILDTVKAIRQKYQDIDIIAGNICTAEGAQALTEVGANCIKVGVGPGSICTTRVVAGVGVPQITAINEVYNWAKDKDVTLIADGGIKYSGDIVKAIAAGAHSVMLGNIFAGTEESPGEEIIANGKKYKTYVGMGSIAAMKRGSSDRYFQKSANKLVPEGIEARVPFKGKVKDVVFQLIGGLKSGMGYTGSKNIEDLRNKTKFVKITNASLKESHPHDVELVKEAPNYNK
ncbi:IMP dehydrogenase [Spiroplasma platyhelix]|uniref:Inosine-5'-monophosphate dehydrogenase n=1 Tax=Spiroplasma platyhelix PALS-1 TaxID=1276218 RepID=A0A846U9E2_9MOLU|nr:IMP dehydrogenase [Spiroplasma platyhelix]MBE4704123.1 Inosine-5'-monophosphate dehydrogenase [Spiroplasma platyhelix PALS-1]NKE38493.1 IMP dehydrogenase [Spiroplasma platyhelix PALS-1]UJB29381.1 inosine 5'-monophosphate dehydrogenase [Spiroplasma platyhelix PALS-1]